MSEKNKLDAQANGKALDDELLTTVSGGCSVCGEEDCNAQQQNNPDKQQQDLDPSNPITQGSANAESRRPRNPWLIR